MLTRPRFKASFDVRPVGSRLLFLLDEHRRVILEGERYPLLAPLLDGERGLSEIVAGVAGRLGLAEVIHALGVLEEKGYLVEGEGAPPAPRRAFAEYFQGGRPAALDEARVAVRALGGADAGALGEALVGNGIALGEGDADLLVVVTDDYLRPELAEVNAAALESGRPWMLAKPLGMVLWVGPVFRPGETGCWACMAQRLHANRQMENFVLAHRGVAGPIITARAALAASRTLGYALAATEAAKWLLAPRGAGLEGKLVTLDLRRRQTTEHALLRRPQCRRCGDPSFQVNREVPPPPLARDAKRFRADGGHRARTPEETYEQYKHHVSPILGAVSQLVPALQGPKSELTHTFVAGHNFSLGVGSVLFLRQSLRGMSGGKGTTEIQAKVSGLAEALERYSGLWTGDEYTRRGRYVDLAPQALHPNACMGFGEAQFAGRERWNATNFESRSLLVPKPFDEEAEVDWTPVWSFVKEEFRYLPTAYCYYGHPDFAARWCTSDSNGNAAGNTIEEAILQGFMEVVERDAVGIWWYNRIRRRALDLDALDLSYVQGIRQLYASLGREIWVLDITSDLGISTLACVSRRIDRPVEDVLLGFGSHFDPKIALLRAITEVNQFIPWVSGTNPDGTTQYLFAEAQAKQWWQEAKVAEHPYLLPHPELPPMRLEDFDDPSSDELGADVHTAVELMGQKGYDLLVLDQTRPDIGLRVAKVVVPELCHFWRRFGKPRLREVPIEMGWLDRRLADDELNPYSIFF
jgi:ribosomal protein S12 methylthiotransferase accessory factor